MATSLLIVALLIVLSVKLGELTMDAEAGAAASQKETINTIKTIALRGERGKILDRNGQPLAFNESSYSVEFIREDQTKRDEAYRPMFTEIMMKTIEIVERNGGKTIDTFPIYRDEVGEFYFDWGNFGSDITEERLQELTASREKNWRENMGLNANLGKDASPKEIYEYLRVWLYVPEDLSYEEARKLLSIWQEVQLNAYTSYLPVTVATNVSEETVAEIETRSNELEGMQTTRSTTRVYPKGELVSHIIGYTGKMNGDEAVKMEGLGYGSSDTIGKVGLEKTQEEYLTGNTTDKQGKQVVEVSQKMQIVRVLETETPKDGGDVITTLDLELQQILQDALAKNIAEINAKQTALIAEDKDDKYSKLTNDLSSIKKAQSGSAVVMEVNTGKVLALVNLPSYDNNDFIRGMTQSEYDTKYGENEARPLSNRAISEAYAPGSIFKMATGLAGLDAQVITAEEKIDDEGPYPLKEVMEEQADGSTKSVWVATSDSPSCWTSNFHSHAQLNIEGALTHSCNYYFFEVANRLHIDQLSSFSSKLGLDQPTQIEIPGEVTGQIGGQKVLYDNTKPINKNGLPGLIDRKLQQQLRTYCQAISLTPTDEEIEQCSQRLIQLVDGTDTLLGEQIRQIMHEELHIPQVVTQSKYWHQAISSMLTELKWNLSQTVRTGIGQGVLQVTPIAVARYVSALVNGGTVYNASIIDRIIDDEGTTVKEVESDVFGTLNVNAEYLEHVKKGMKQVVSLEDGGTAGEAFKDFEAYIDQIGGKTGTAQISATNNIDIENTSWMVAFAPYDEPEIAVVVCIPNGLSGSSSATTVKEVLKFYLDRKNAEIENNILAANALTK